MKAKKNILQVCHGYNPPFLDVGNQYARLFTGPEQRVTTLYLSGAQDDKVARMTVADEVLFFELTSKELKGLKFGVVARLKALLRTGQYDLVICHRYKAIYLVGLCRLSLPAFRWLGVVHDFRVFASLARRMFVRFLGKDLNLIGVSAAIEEDLAQSCPAHRHKIYTLPNSVDIAELKAQQYTRQAARERLGLDPEAFIFGNAGRLHPVKDQTTLLRAFAMAATQLPSAQLVLMGEGRLAEDLKSLAADLGVRDRVSFLGQVPEGPRYFRAFDVFVLSSTKEPFGMVLIEAMAAEVPVISARTGGTGEVVGSVGKLFEPGQPAQLCTLLVQARNWTEDERAEYIRNASERLEQKFSTDAVRQRFWRLPFMQSV